MGCNVARRDLNQLGKCSCAPPPQPGAPAHLHGADAEAAVDDELAERGRALVAVAAVHHEQAAQVLELGDGEVCSQGSLLAFLKPAQNWAP